MPKVEVKKHESIDRALKKFKTLIKREGLIEEMKKREFYEKPSQRRRRKMAQAVRRQKKLESEQ